MHTDDGIQTHRKTTAAEALVERVGARFDLFEDPAFMVGQQGEAIIFLLPAPEPTAFLFRFRRRHRRLLVLLERRAEDLSDTVLDELVCHCAKSKEGFNKASERKMRVVNLFK